MELQQPLVSIIVSVYNTQAYLPMCLDSVLAQTYTFWELVIMDDGSTDGSPAICDDYAHRDERIHVLHKPNTGKADSCNQAISLAKGEYITFVDSDDWLEPTFLDTLLQSVNLTGKQCASCSYLYDYKDAVEVELVTNEQRVLNRDESIKVFYSRQLGSYLCGRLFHRSLLKEPVPQLLRYEDQAVLYKWLSHGNGIVLSPACMYHYRQRSSSVMNNGSTAFGLVPIMQECYQYVADHQLLSEAENKQIIVTQLVREAKYAARAGGESLELVNRIRLLLSSIQPINSELLDSKTYRRLQKLLHSPRWFVFSQQLSSLFVRGHRKTEHQYFT